ncbi:MAG: hypothetical protein L0K27_01680 [Corynebacterium nuruki]|nr:hypothetical protein [Corynebacterium nuruki]
MKGPLPYMLIPVRRLLLAEEAFVGLLDGGTVTTRDMPSELTTPAVLIRSMWQDGEDAQLRNPAIQVIAVVPDNYAPESGPHAGKDPDEAAWDIVARAATILDFSRSREFRGAAWRASWTEGPVSEVGSDRDATHPLYTCTITVQMTVVPPDTL